MTQNLTSLDLAEELPQLDAALDTIDRILKAFVSLDADQMRRLSKLGDKTESFCRQTAAILDQNRQALPPGFDLDELKRDFAAFDLLRPRLNRIEALAAKCADTQIALGSDILSASYDGYALLKVFGKADNVAPLRDSLRSGIRRKTVTPGKASAS